MHDEPDAGIPHVRICGSWGGAIPPATRRNGRRSPKERARFFDISLASIAETSSAIDILEAYRLISIPKANEIKSNLHIAYAMIMKLKKSMI